MRQAGANKNQLTARLNLLALQREFAAALFLKVFEIREVRNSCRQTINIVSPPVILALQGPVSHAIRTNPTKPMRAYIQKGSQFPLKIVENHRLLVNVQCQIVLMVRQLRHKARKLPRRTEYCLLFCLEDGHCTVIGR
jgi:hypothetical protein